MNRVRLPNTLKPKWILENTVLAVVHGSRSYGLDTPESDTDIKGVFIPRGPHVYGVEELEQVRFQGSDTDVVVWDIRKFFRNLFRGDTNAAETLCTASHHVITEHPYAVLRKHAKRLLSAQTYYSYVSAAKGQHNKMMRQRETALAGPDTEPLRSEYVSRASFDKAWAQWNKRKALGPNQYDTKTASHVIRCLLFADELARTGWIPVHTGCHRDVDVLAIREGRISFEEYDYVYNRCLVRARDAELATDLPMRPDRDFINEVCETYIRGMQ